MKHTFCSMVCEVLGEKSAFIVVVRSVVFTRVIYRQAHAGVCLAFFFPLLFVFSMLIGLTK